MGRRRRPISNSPLITEYNFGESDMFPVHVITETQRTEGSLALELQLEKLSLESGGLVSSDNNRVKSQRKDGKLFYAKSTPTIRQKSWLF